MPYPIQAPMMLGGALGLPPDEEEAPLPNEYGTVRMLRGNRNSTAVFSRPRGTGEAGWQNQGEYYGVLPNTQFFQDRDRANANYNQSVAGGMQPSAANLQRQMSTTNDPRLLMGGAELGQRQQEIDYKQSAHTDPSRLALALTQMAADSGISPQSIAGMLPFFRQQLQGGGDAQPTASGPLPTITQAHGDLAQLATDPLIAALGGVNGDGIGLSRRILQNPAAILNDKQALSKLIPFIRARASADPDYARGSASGGEAAMLLRALLGGGDVLGSFVRDRDAYRKLTESNSRDFGGGGGQMGSY